MQNEQHLARTERCGSLYPPIIEIMRNGIRASYSRRGVEEAVVRIPSALSWNDDDADNIFRLVIPNNNKRFRIPVGLIAGCHRNDVIICTSFRVCVVRIYFLKI